MKLKAKVVALAFFMPFMNRAFCYFMIFCCVALFLVRFILHATIKDAISASDHRNATQRCSIIAIQLDNKNYGICITSTSFTSKYKMVLGSTAPGSP
ncbi:hypothetical protein BH10BAC2_BH10BAC2_19140 [soil metagenome]